MRRSIPWLSLFFTLLVPTSAWAAVYNEAVNGDISGDRLNPTALPLDPGQNPISATSVSGDIEYFTITVPAGRRVNSIRVTSYTGVDQRAFTAVQNGSTFTEPPVGTNVAALLGYSHFGPSVEPVGSNILDNIAEGPGSQGFGDVLGPGVYTFWAQQTGGNPSSYTLTVDLGSIPAVPVPPLFAAFLFAGLGVLGIHRARTRTRRAAGS